MDKKFGKKCWVKTHANSSTNVERKVDVGSTGAGLRLGRESWRSL